MKTKLDVSALSDTSIKDYQPKLRNEIRRLEASGERCPLIVFAEYEFNCGTVGALLIIGELNGDLGRFVKQNRKNRSAQKDYGEGECWVEASPKGNLLQINLSEGVSSTRLAKGLKKTKLKSP